MMFVSSFATPYVMLPLLYTIGLRGAKFVYFEEAIKLWGDSTGWVHFPVARVTESSCLFDVPEWVAKFVSESSGGSFLMIL